MSEQVLALRRLRYNGLRIAMALGLSRPTVSRILRRAGMNRLRSLEPPPPVLRYEHKRPGSLIHFDIKRLARIVTATSGGVSGSQTGILVGDAVWVLSHNGHLNKLNSQDGSSVAQIQTYVMSNGNSGGLAMDGSGDIWEANNYVFGVARINPAGSSSTEFSGGGVTSPDAIAIDGAGYVWVANASGNNVSEFNNSGTALSGSNGYGSAYNLSAPSGVAIDGTGGVWVANKTGNSVTHIFGAAAPVVTPLAAATANGTLGMRP